MGLHCYHISTYIALKLKRSCLYYVSFIYICIYIEREREREKKGKMYGIGEVEMGIG